MQSGLLTDAELIKQKVDNVLFKNVFHKDIRVKGFLQEDLSVKRINSFPLTHIHDFLVKNYLQTAIESPKEKLSAEKFIDDDRFGIISQFRLNESEISKLDNPAELRTPLKAQDLKVRKTDSAQNHQTILRANYFIPFAKKADPHSDFTQFNTFHKLGKEPKRIALPKLKKPEFEFHDIMAAINNYPQLMRKFGFVLDFQIPYIQPIPSSGTIHVIPVSLGLSDATTIVSTPPVAYEITKTGFYIADKADTIFKRGFVKINTDEFSVVQIDADGAALKTSNLTENKVQQVAKYFEDKSKLLVNSKINLTNIQSKSQILIEGLPVSPAFSTDKIEFIPPPEDEGLPSIRTAGIAITKNGMAEHIFSRIISSVNLQTNLLSAAPLNSEFKIRIPANILYSNDLVQGYRMDIAYENDPDKWYSLHQR